MSEMEFDFTPRYDRGKGDVGFIARYNGRCPVCDKKIHAETDRIMFIKMDVNDYVHVGCGTGEPPVESDPMPQGQCMVCWQARAANGTCGCL